MKKNISDYKNVENMSEEELKKIREFSLIDCNVHIKTLAENKDGQAPLTSEDMRNRYSLKKVNELSYSGNYLHYLYRG